jgi:kinetochore protein Nuf2
LNQFACAACTSTLQDIHKPEPARLRRHLSAIINFAKFREEKLVVYRCAQQQQFDAFYMPA